MNKSDPLPLTLEELAKLCFHLKNRLDRLEGNVKQLLAEQIHETGLRPTWKDFESLQTEIGRLNQCVK
jgi:hypothetical protein